MATLRKRQLLSQRDLANRAGVALSTIHLLEAGKTTRVTFKVMRAVSEALGVSPAAMGMNPDGTPRLERIASRV